MQPAFAAPPPGSDPVRQVFDRLRAGLDGRTYDNWIDGKITLAVVDDELTVGVGSPFLLAWMQRQFSAPLRTAARAVLGPSARLRFIVDARMGLPTPRGAVGQASKAEANGSAGVQAARPSKPEPDRRPLRTARRLSDLAEFVDGRHSELAYSAALRFCESPASFPGPFYVFGGVGLGKTHLLEGIAQRLRGSAVGRQIAYFTAEAFANYFTEALRSRTLPAFRNRFRGVDVLLLDDVDFFDGKRGLQEELLHTLQHLESHGRTMAFGADRHPKMLTRTGEELVTRFLAGTVCRIEPPDLESRIRILEQKTGRSAAPVERPVLEMIARRFRGSVRELEGALNCLDVYRGLAGRPVGVATARQVLGELERDCLRAVRLLDIERAVCELFGVEPQELRSPSRSRTVSQPRMLAMFLARKLTQAAYGEIGAHFGGRNHSTVIAAEKKVRSLLDRTAAWNVAAESVPLGELVRSIESRLRAS